MTPELERRIAHQQAVISSARPFLPIADAPYFAHMRIVTGDREREVLLSSWAKAAEDVWVLDWQRSPLADVFFECSEGEEYELEIDGRPLNGRVLERNLVRFERGELVGLVTPDAVVERGASGWRQLPPLAPSLRAHSPHARRALSPVEVELDAAQRRIVELPPHRSALILGEAGCGKTTVALHRLAHLWRSRKAKTARAAVIVPTPALERLTEMLLSRLGVHGVEVWQYDAWAARQARLAFPALPKRESQNATGGVVRIKRDPALRLALEEIAARPPPAPLKATKGTRRSELVRRDDLFQLFGDRALMERVVGASQFAIPKPAIDEVIAHSKVQFSETTEQQFSYVRKENLETVDGRTIDAGTPTEDVMSIDTEDYAVLFELDRMRAKLRGGRPVTPKPYDFIVVDEAQELAPLELALIGRSLARGGTLTIAGDAEQQVDATSCFLGWESTMQELGAGEHERVTLEVSYRCPADVTDLARKVRKAERVSVASATPSIDQVRFDNECHEVAWFIDALRDLRGRDPGSSVAVICRSAEAASRMSRLINRGVDARLALDGEFDFHSGLHVTAVGEVKGLEFDYVLLPDAAAHAYPETPAARRAFYVAMTRVIRQLVLGSVGEPTPIVGRL